MEEFEHKIWKSEKLRKELVIDVETTVADFHTYDHKLVLFQAYDGSGVVYLVRTEDVKRFFIRNSEAKYIFHNAVFDLDVIMSYIGQDKIFNLIDNNQIYCTKLLYKLYTLAAIGEVPFKSSLKHVSKQLCGIELDKAGDERTTFGDYLGLPIEEIPEAHIKYACEDVIATFAVYCKLLALIKPHDKMGTLLSYSIQIKGDYALYRAYKNGIGFDVKERDKVVGKAEAEMEGLELKLAMWGLVRGKPGYNSTFEEALKILGIYDELPRTETGRVSSAADDLADFDHIPFIRDYLRFTYLEKSISFVKNLDSDVIHPQYNTILNTGRTSCRNPNIQNMPKIGGIRECFVPRNNKVFIDIDYNALELATLSEVLIELYGHSKLAETINSGTCPHIRTAGILYNKDTGKGIKGDMGDITGEERQFAKVANFGLPANMSASTFVDYCKPMGLDVTESDAEDVKQAFLDAYPKMTEYFKEPNKHENGNREYDHYTLTGRKRARCTYTAFLNSGFQGLAADGAKLALYGATKAGLKIVAFIHDSIMIESPRCTAEQDKKKLEEIMISEMKKVVKQVNIGVEGKITERMEK